MRTELLLVEDSAGEGHLNVAADGAEALAFPRREAPYAGAPRPSLILLDLNLPKVDGREVLFRIKEDLSKPVEFGQFENLVKSINNFWLTKTGLA